MQNKRRKQCLGWLCLAGGLLSTVACSEQAGQGQEASMTTQQASAYKLMTVSLSDKAMTTPYSATIRGRQDVDIYAQVAGTMQRMCVTEGERVRKGQLLFVIDQVPYQAAVTTAKANVKVAESAMATAKLTYDSNKELYAKKVISEFTLKTSENAYLQAEAQKAQADAQLISAQNNLSYTEVKSPSDGVVGALPYRVGTLVSSAMPQPLTTVSDNKAMYVYFSMTEDQLLALTRQYGSMDEAVKAMPELQLQLKDGSIYESTGRIESVSGVIDRATGTVTARAVFDNEQGLLHSGASGKVLLPSVHKSCIVIPQAATMMLQDKILVYKVVDGKAVSTLVKVSDVNDGRDYVVTEGLSVGDEILAAGVGLVREGTPLK